MGKVSANVLMRQLRRLAPGGSPEQGSDGDLLRRYATHHDEAAFATLRRRLERGKRLLHARLTRRGLTLTVALAAPALADAVPPTALAGAARGNAATKQATALAQTLLASGAGKFRAVLAFVLVCVVA